MRLSIVAGVSLLGLAAAASPASAQNPHTLPGPNLLVNGSFQTGDFTGWTGSIVSDTGSNSIQTDYGYALAPPGSALNADGFPNYLSFGSTSFENLSQTINGLTVGTQYVVSGWFQGDGQSGAYAAMDITNSGVPGTGFSPIPDSNYPAYNYLQFVFTAASTSATFNVYLQDANSTDGAGNFGVAVYTPEPADLAIFGTSLVGFLAIRRRRGV
jgi:hypothetical protein